MDADLYVQILNDELVKTINFYGLEKKEIVFQQDNDPKHTSKVAKQALK